MVLEIGHAEHQHPAFGIGQATDRLQRLADHLAAHTLELALAVLGQADQQLDQRG